LGSWRVSIIRSRGHYLSVVEVPDRAAAEATAVREFKLTDEQRRRLPGDLPVQVPTKDRRNYNRFESGVRGMTA
jgi:hypothetical protein